LESGLSSLLTPTQEASFVRDGYVVVPEVFPREVAERLLPFVWARLSGVTADPSTWTSPSLQIEEVIADGPVDAIFTERFHSSVDDLVGAGRWTTRRGFGWVILRFPNFHHPPWQPPASGWHIDGIDFQHHLTSPEQGLVGIELLTDIEPGGGGTAVRIGSHNLISGLLRDSEPEGLSYQQLRQLCDGIRDLPAREVVGQAGDVIWMHPHLVHARSPNTRETVRIASNRRIRLRQPMVLDRRNPAEDSLVERTIRAAIG
jgi:Phytanoyl-CoA dioxygenase (PhyH)